MSSYTQIIYQIIFSTKYREKVLTKENRPELFMFIHGILKNKKCRSYQVNGVEDHLHIITGLHPSVALADLVKDIKLGTSGLIKERKLFPDFKSWQIGYAAFTYSKDALNNLIKYVERQEEHHAKKSSKEELEVFLETFEVEYDERYFE
jgi:REP element-mobilizing transposase RayT